MTVLFIVLPLAIIIVIGALLAFAWAARSGQFDDLDTPAVRMLHDDVPADGENKESSERQGRGRSSLDADPLAGRVTRSSAEESGGPRSGEGG